MKEVEITFVKTGYLSPREPASVILPTKWSEVTEDQFIAIIGLLLREFTLKEMLNVVTDLNIGIHEELSNKSAADAISTLDEIRQPDICSSFIIKEFKGRKVFNPMIMNHTLEALALGVLYHKLPVNNNDTFVSKLLRLTACFYCDQKGFRKDNIDCFFTLVDLKADIIRLAAINFNFILIYKWLKEKYPYACRLSDPDVQTTDKLDWFQVAYFGDPAFYSHYTLMDSLKKIDLSIKEYTANGIKSAKMLEKLLYSSSN